MIVRARVVVTMNGPPIENGAVAIEGNRIDDSPPGSSPSRAARLRRAAPAGSVVDVGLFNEVKARNSGEVVDLSVESLKSKETWGLAPHALFTASADLYRHCEEVTRAKNILLTTHLAESREEMSMFRDASGSLYEFMKGIGRPMDDCGHETPFALFVGRRALSGRWIIAHLNELAASDFDLLARSTGKFHVVHSPRSHGYFAHSRFPFEKLQAFGFKICLGTDSLASNEDLSLFAEMRAFQKNEPRTSPEEIVSMVTVNPARALRQKDALGKIRRGFCADLIAIPCARSTNALEEIIAFDRPVDWTVLDGKIR